MSDRPMLLTGLHVLECTATVAGAYCGKLLADLGADVVKIEPPGGDPARGRGPFPNDVPHLERGGLFLYLNTNKRGRVMDFGNAAATAAVEPLVGWADLLIEDFQAAHPRPPALSIERIRAANPRLVTVSVTHFGRTGPYAGWRGSELVDFHMSGLGYLTPGNVDEPAEPPLKGPGYMAEQLAGLTAAVAALGAWALAERTGEAVEADVSALEASVAMMLLNVPWLPYEGHVPSRMRGKRKGIPLEPLPCADGAFTFLTVEPAQWDAWVEVMGCPAWAADPVLRDRNVRAEHWEELRPRIVEWASHHGKQEIARRGQARRVPVFPVNTTEDLFCCPQLAARGFLTPISHPETGELHYPGLPYHIDGPPTSRWQPAPRLGEHNGDVIAPAPRPAPSRPRRQTDAMPLAGVRVADFSWVLAGPHCTKWLAALGADVIRVETHRRLDQFRRAAPFADGIPDPDRAGSFHAINFGKRGITLDLTKPEAVQYARDLIAVSDVVIENFATGQMERFGLSLPVIRAIRPDVIVASSSGVGRTGPYREDVAYGTTIHAYAGLTGLIGQPGDPPRGMATTYTDPLTGATQAFAILAALRYRQRTGRGCDIDLSMAEATMALLPGAFLDYTMNGRVAGPSGNRDPQHAPHGVYPCRPAPDQSGSADCGLRPGSDSVLTAGARLRPEAAAIRGTGESPVQPQFGDSWVAIAVDSEGAWRALCGVIGRPEWLTDPRFATASDRVRHRDALDADIASWTSCRSPMEVTRILQQAGVAAGPSATVADLLNDPHLRARNFFIAPEHPLTGARSLPGIPWRLTPDPGAGRPLRPAPLLGQHNTEVFGELLGLAADLRQRLVDARVIH